jgi:hypothetical protein
MAGAPAWKIYDGAGKYQAACKEIEAAAALVSFYGLGTTIRHDHGKILWREGREHALAGDSYDVVERTVTQRLQRLHQEGLTRSYGGGVS